MIQVRETPMNYKPKVKHLPYAYLDTLQPEIIHNLCFSFEYMVLGRVCLFFENSYWGCS